MENFVPGDGKRIYVVSYDFAFSCLVGVPSSSLFLRRVLSIFHPKTRMENFSQGCGYGYVPDNDNAFSSITKAPFFGTLIISILIMGLGSGLRYIRDVFSPSDHKNANIWKRSLREHGKDSFPLFLCIAYRTCLSEKTRGPKLRSLWSSSLQAFFDSFRED